jgi:hypothetical protein
MNVKARRSWVGPLILLCVFMLFGPNITSADGFLDLNPTPPTVQPSTPRTAPLRPPTTEARPQVTPAQLRDLNPKPSTTAQPATLDAILSRIANRNRSGGAKAEFYIDRGFLVDKWAGSACFQWIYSARLSELDLQKSAVTVNPRERGTVFLSIPCKTGMCVTWSVGTHAWEVMGFCTLRSDTETKHLERLEMGLPGDLADEFLAVLKAK